MHSVLDLDLDFFVWPIALDVEEDGQRLDPQEYFPKSEQQVRSFLEGRCGLSTTQRIPGRFVLHHMEAFSTLREWLEQDILAKPFDVVHVDANADLGSSSGLINNSPRFFETELLRLPLEQRCSPRFGVDAVNSGNYLVAAIANRWINKLTYVYPADPTPCPPATIQAFARMEKLRRLRNDEDEWFPTDLPPYWFKSGDPNTRRIELKEYSTNGYSRVGLSTRPIHVEPEIPFDWVEGDKFQSSGFTHMVLAQSPSYTPQSADHLIQVISEYFTPA